MRLRTVIILIPFKKSECEEERRFSVFHEVFARRPKEPPHLLLHFRIIRQRAQTPCGCFRYDKTPIGLRFRKMLWHRVIRHQRRPLLRTPVYRKLRPILHLPDEVIHGHRKNRQNILLTVHINERISCREIKEAGRLLPTASPFVFSGAVSCFGRLVRILRLPCGPVPGCKRNFCTVRLFLFGLFPGGGIDPGAILHADRKGTETVQVQNCRVIDEADRADRIAQLELACPPRGLKICAALRHKRRLENHEFSDAVRNIFLYRCRITYETGLAETLTKVETDKEMPVILEKNGINSG